MSRQTRPLEAVFVLSFISVFISYFGFCIPVTFSFLTIVYHVAIGIAHVRASPNGNQSEPRLVVAFTSMDDVRMNVWQSAFGVNGVKLEDDGTNRDEGEPGMERQESRERLHPTATLTSLVVVCFLIVVWLALSVLITVLAVLESWQWFWLDLKLWVMLVEIFMEVGVLVTIAKICKRMRNSFFAEVQVRTLEEGEKAGE